MKFSNEMQRVLDHAKGYARGNNHKYFMPEHLIYGLTFDETFSEEYEASGGNIQKLRSNVAGFLNKQAEKSPEEDTIIITADTKKLLYLSEQQASNSGRDEVETSHLLASLLKLEDSYGLYYILEQDVDLLEIIGEMSRDSLSDRECVNATGGMEESPEEDTDTKNHKWKDFLEDMSETYKKHNKMIGREAELERTIQILCRKDKNNVLHIGEPGVGKTAIAYGLAHKIADEQVPEPLIGAHLYAMDLGSLLAGTQYRGDFEKRFKGIMDGLSNEECPILYIDEIHNAVGAGAVNGGSLDVANLMKPYLASGHIRFIGATTYEEYKKHFSNSRSLVRRFQNVDINEPSKEEAVEILNGLRDEYEDFHNVKYEAGVVEHAVEVSSKYVNERYLPDKAIDLIDEAGAYRRLHPLNQEKQTVDKMLVDEVLAKTCRIPIQTVELEETQKLAVLEEHLKKKIFGQDEAVRNVVNAVKFSRAGLNDDNKPIASFLFVGATGVGKTELAKVLANELGISFIRFDMSEYAEKHAVAKLIGSPAGYVGYEEGGLLTEEIRKHPHAVLLLDEIEKAHPDIFNILLQVMDYATLTDNQGRKADFRNIVLIMTSNAGASQIGKSSIGFGDTHLNMDALTEAVKKTFQPEFRNRLSKTVLFNGMDDTMAERITTKKLGELSDKLVAKKVELKISQEAIKHVKKAGITKEYGAREIDRVINAEVKPLLVDLMLFGKLKDGGECRLEVDGNDLIINVE